MSIRKVRGALSCTIRPQNWQPSKPSWDNPRSVPQRLEPGPRLPGGVLGRGKRPYLVGERLELGVELRAVLAREEQAHVLPGSCSQWSSVG